MTSSEFLYKTSGASLFARVVPYDSKAFGFPVIQIEEIVIENESQAKEGYGKFEEWRDLVGAQIVACRLQERKLKESFFLEKNGFRFIEMILHPVATNIQNKSLPDLNLRIEIAMKKDIPLMRNIAKRSFRYERFHVDPRLNPKFGDIRYGNWVSSSFDGQQQILKISENSNLVAFFIIEKKSNVEVYWHLTAIAPEFQGQGYGKRIWKAMLHYHAQQEITTVETSISARNIPVLNLYAYLGFRFLPSEMTFHWVREKIG